MEKAIANFVYALLSKNPVVKKPYMINVQRFLQFELTEIDQRQFGRR